MPHFILFRTPGKSAPVNFKVISAMLKRTNAQIITPTEVSNCFSQVFRMEMEEGIGEIEAFW